MAKGERGGQSKRQAPDKALRRHQPTGRKTPVNDDGYWGIKEPNAAAAFGRVVSYWPHIEEQMIAVFEELISGERAGSSDQPASRASREIFRAIVSQSTRIKIMSGLLRESPHNKTKGAIYDEIIMEYDQLNDIRNDYVHGLWKWNEQNNMILLFRPSREIMQNVDPEIVSLDQMQRLLDRMQNFWTKIVHRHEPPSSP